MAGADELCRSFLDLWWHFDPAAATRAGVSGQDSRLGTFDAEAQRQHVAAFKSIALAVEDLEIEAADEEIDRTALLDHVRVLLFRLEKERPYQTNPALWVGHACQAFDGLLVKQGEGAAAAALDRLRALPGFLNDARQTVRQPPMLFLEAALAEIDALELLLAEVERRFTADWSLVGEGAGEALRDAGRAVHGMRHALASEPAPNPDPGAVAIGEEELDRRLHHEHASVHNAAEVWRATLRLAAEVEAEVTALAAAIDPARPWRDVYEGAAAAASGGASPLGLMAAALDGAIGFATARGFGECGPVTVVSMAPHERVFEPVARYHSAGAGMAAVAVALPDLLALPWLGVRLGSPGLHLYHSRRAALSRIVRRHIAAASTPLGWSLYAADGIRAEGYAADPLFRLAERILFLTDVQVAVADLGIHTRQFTPDEAVGHLTARLPLSRAAAMAHVRRVSARPTEAAAAILGWREFRRLEADTRAARGADFDLRRFHDDILGYGGLPVPLMRWGMGLDG
ncbi:MAG: DUF885 family protein [Gemmatimonadales bacterium]|nr:DUF885 family protein [Gemmatimonadales bacterium]